MNNLKRAIDTDLSRLRTTERERSMILENALEGKKVKKKLSVAFVLILVLVLAAAVALAYTLLSNQYFEDVATLESEHGYYDEWSLDEKLAMLQIMKNYGVDIDAAETDALLAGGMPDSEREQRIDALIVNKYGFMGRADVVTLESVLAAELGGGIETWTMEQKAWYSQMLIDTGLMGGDDDLFRMPGEDAITPDEAIAIAKIEIMRVWGMTEDDLKDYTVDWVYLTHVSDKEEKWLHYEVTFKPRSGKGDWLNCPVSSDGRVLSRTDGELFSSPEEEKAAYAELENQVDQEARDLFQQYALEHGFIKPVGEASLAFTDWPLEDKKALSDLLRPVVRKNMAKNPRYADWAFAFYAEHFYGLPDEKAISQQAAQETAYRALSQRLNLTEALLAYCDHSYVFYDVTDPANPLWKFTYSAGAHYDAVKALGFEPPRYYRVFINAYTGEVTDAFSYIVGDGVTGLEAVIRAS